jgi:hypothetical protein
MINGYIRAQQYTKVSRQIHKETYILILFAGFGRISAASSKKEVIEIYIFLSMM